MTKLSGQTLFWLRFYLVIFAPLQLLFALLWRPLCTLLFLSPKVCADLRVEWRSFRRAWNGDVR